MYIIIYMHMHIYIHTCIHTYIHTLNRTSIVQCALPTPVYKNYILKI